MKERALIIFIRNPEKGKVKTRLAATLGAGQALRIYEALLDHTRKTAEGVDAQRYLYYSHFIEPHDSWAPEHFQKCLQEGNNLGARMQNAFDAVLQTHAKAIIIGSDCADLTPELIEAGFRRLDNHDLVIGPALDGGYYLLGMKKNHPALFQNMSWSTPTVYQDTLARARAGNLSVATLPSLSDIDYEEDWKAYGWNLN